MGNEDTLRYIMVGDWGAAAESIAHHFCKSRFDRMGAREQTTILHPITMKLLEQNMRLNYGLPSHESPIEMRLAQEIYEKTCSDLGFNESDMP